MAQNDSNPTPPPEPLVAAEPITEDLVQDKEEEDDSSKIVIPVPESESLSLKEDSNRVSDSEKNAIDELKKLLKEELEDEEVSIWGVPLFKDDRTDVILLKFLRARELKVKDALVMFQNTLRWRKDFNIDALLDEDLGDHLEKVVFMHGHGREGHPVCYNVYGEFQNKDLYHKAFSSQDNRNKFLRWRIQLLERSIRHLDFTPSSGINTIFQVNDLKNSPGPAKRELRLATKQALQLLQDNYPEFVAKQVLCFPFLHLHLLKGINQIKLLCLVSILQVFINVPWWYLAFYTMINPFLTQRTKSKFVFAGPSKSPDTLFKLVYCSTIPLPTSLLSLPFIMTSPSMFFFKH